MARPNPTIEPIKVPTPVKFQIIAKPPSPSPPPKFPKFPKFKYWPLLVGAVAIKYYLDEYNKPKTKPVLEKDKRLYLGTEGLDNTPARLTIRCGPGSGQENNPNCRDKNQIFISATPVSNRAIVAAAQNASGNGMNSNRQINREREPSLVRENPGTNMSDVVVWGEKYYFVEIPADVQQPTLNQLEQVLAQIESTVKARGGKSGLQSLAIFYKQTEDGPSGQILMTTIKNWLQSKNTAKIELIPFEKGSNPEVNIEAVIIGSARTTADRPHITSRAEPKDFLQNPEQQIKSALNDLNIQLRSTGLSNERLLHTTIHLPHPEDLNTFNLLWKKWLPRGHPPTRAVVPTQLKKGQRIRIDYMVAPD